MSNEQSPRIFRPTRRHRREAPEALPFSGDVLRLGRVGAAMSAPSAASGQRASLGSTA